MPAWTEFHSIMMCHDNLRERKVAWRRRQTTQPPIDDVSPGQGQAAGNGEQKLGPFGPGRKDAQCHEQQTGDSDRGWQEPVMMPVPPEDCQHARRHGEDKHPKVETLWDVQDRRQSRQRGKDQWQRQAMDQAQERRAKCKAVQKGQGAVQIGDCLLMHGVPNGRWGERYVTT
jgi:hypothetical protein